MRLRSLTPTTAAWILWLVILLFCNSAFATTDPAHNGTELVCVPYGECEPCPEELLSEPFCKAFGNRRLLHCLPASKTGTPNNHPDSTHRQDSTVLPGGEQVAWESCGRIPAVERYDFYEFVACNIGITVCALVLLWFRARRNSAAQAGRLAARIGLGRPL